VCHRESSGYEAWIASRDTRSWHQIVAMLTLWNGGAPAAVHHSPDQTQAGPVVVDRGDLDVDEAERERYRADHVVGDVAAVPRGAARPGHPDRPGREDPLRQAGQLRVQFGRRAAERDDHVSGRVR